MSGPGQFPTMQTPGASVRGDKPLSTYNVNPWGGSPYPPPNYQSKPFGIQDSGLHPVQQFPQMSSPFGFQSPPQMSKPFIQSGGQTQQQGQGSPGMTGVPANSVANMFGPQSGQVQSFFDSIRKYAPGQQATQGSTAPMPGDPQNKGIIITEGEQQYSPAPWQPAQTPNYLQPPTAAFLYGADPWQRTDPRQVWSGGAGGQWGLQPGYNGVK